MIHDDRIRLHLRRWRERLLDQTARNPLLKLDASRVSRLQVITPEPEALFRMLVLEQRSLRMPLVRPVRRRGAAAPLAAADDVPDEALRIEPGDVVFAAGAGEIRKRLRRIRDNARVSLEERGVHTLHLALGMLHFHDERLGGESAAPLWLVPCRLEVHGPDRPLTLEPADEEPGINPTLELFLRERHKLVLPEVPDEPTAGAFRTALDAISDLAAERGWRIEPEAWLATFSFESLVLWRDLQALEPDALEHPVARAFARVAQVESTRTEPLPEDLDTLPLADRVPVPILETDSSQLEALTLAADGRNLVVHGPPGTGKSQTIANLIADALGRGKTVLFVSAKMAALEVVHRRLVEQGLGDGCLEAHSARGGRTKVLAELRRVMETAMREPESVLGEKVGELDGAREKLNAYVRALHAKRGPLGRSLYDAIGRAEELRAAPDLRFALPWPDVLAVTAGELAEVRDALEELTAFADLHDARDRHPWRGFQPPADAAIDQSLEAHLQALADGAERLAVLGLPFRALDGSAREREELERARAALAEKISLDAISAASLLRQGLYRWLDWTRWLSPAFHDWRRQVRERLAGGTADDFDSLRGVLRLARDVVEREERVEGLPEVPLEEVAALRASFAAVGSCWPEGFGGPQDLRMEDAPLESIAARCRELLDAREKRDAFARMLLARDRALRLGLAPLLQALGARARGAPEAPRNISVREAADAFERRFQFAWAAAAIREDESLSMFESERHEKLVERFREADLAARRAALRHIREQVSARAVAVRDAVVDAGETAVLRRELARRRSPKPLRKLFAEAPHALLALKPCLLMSPISVSTWLPPSMKFDLVVFDEASQVPTAQAMPAILRAAQTVVAGDPKQMPPSSFFDAAPEETEGEDASDVEPLESLLDECVASVPAFREAHLRWHYRSQDERLIRFSNHWFYEDRLITFPSTTVWAADGGVRFVHVPDGIWDRGRSRRNVTEARRVAQVVAELFRDDPARSVGVIAMNAGQKEAIEDALVGLLPARESAAEPFFVKALENVQGDERDVVVVSLGYGRDAGGSLTLNFGPLNDEGGWRRLNVLVTRAKRQTVVVSSLLASDLAGVNPANRGACALRDYLAYAEGGGVLATGPALEDPGNDAFVRTVRDSLEERGFRVDTSVGVSGCRVDLGVRHPDDDSRYVLGVECDGEGYASARTARDREVLRRAALEAKGWRLHRIWSTDWFRDRDRALDRLLKAITRARASTRPRVAALPPPAQSA